MSTKKTKKTISMSLTVKVTKDDIRLGKRRDGQHCPIARALGRKLLNTKYLWDRVGLYRGKPILAIKNGICCFAEIENGAQDEVDWIAVFPRSVSEFVSNFDRKLPVKPGTFTLKFTRPAR
jgi:hypothetical protein